MSATFTALGRVGKEPQLRDAGGIPVLSFSFVTNDYVKGENVGSWWNVSFFGKRAQSLAPHIQKGSQLVVSGSVSQRKYVANGEDRISCDVNANNIDFAGPKAGAGDSRRSEHRHDDDALQF